MNPNPIEQWLDPREVAARTGVSHTTAKRLMRRQVIASTLFYQGSRRALRSRPAAVVEFLNQHPQVKM